MDQDNSDTAAAVRKLKELMQDGSLPEALGEAQREEVAQYICSMMIELRTMALEHEMRFLVYLIEMAFQEAYKQAESSDKEAA
ncbi:MAG: hypothetical protein AAF441_06025 [Pseudomonadota bacterium]